VFAIAQAMISLLVFLADNRRQPGQRKRKGSYNCPKRWIVERTIAWLNRCRRLAKDWENLNRSALAFLKLASIRLMLRKLCNP
jgi:transposase